MKIWQSPYQLFPKGYLNSKMRVKFRKGTLLRVRFEDGRVGFADLCPFQEMGDRPLEHELRALLRNKPEGLSERALFFADLDSRARAQKVSLYSSEIRIKNHFLIPQITEFSLDRIPSLEASGFSEFKIKMGRDIFRETVALEALCKKISNTTHVRLDFNANLSRDQFMEWFEKNQPWLRSRLDYIEDPFSYDAKEWSMLAKKFNIRFALDQAADPLDVSCEGAEILVLKPVRQEDLKIIDKFINSKKKFVYTHNMDFPLGQMEALVSAQAVLPKLGERLLTCGLQHHDIYEGFTFQDVIRKDGPYIIPPEGTGLGFDSILEELTWQEII